ncbi:MAG TPA: hypothetical protein VF062_02750 [Candidatus Limnocylindrales bacterium]
MAVIRLDRFKADPANTDELISRRNALIAAVRRATPGLVQTRLARVDDETWIDMWCWDTASHAQAAVRLAQAGQIPEAGAAFALTTDATTEFAEIIEGEVGT